MEPPVPKNALELGDAIIALIQSMGVTDDIMIMSACNIAYRASFARNAVRDYAVEREAARGVVAEEAEEDASEEPEEEPTPTPTPTPTPAASYKSLTYSALRDLCSARKIPYWNTMKKKQDLVDALRAYDATQLSRTVLPQ